MRSSEKKKNVQPRRSRGCVVVENEQERAFARKRNNKVKQATREEEEDERLPSREIVKEMLERENELRLSDDVQRKMAEAEESGMSDWMRVAEQVQKQVAQEFGMSEEKGLEALRTAAWRFSGDKELLSIPVYIKYNRNRRGDLKEGDKAPDVTLQTLEGASVSLLSMTPANHKPLIVFAGSYT